MTRVTTKDPDAILPYGVDWSAFLASVENDVIDTAEWLPVDGLTVDDQGVTNDVHVAVVGGGVSGRAYRLTSRITTVSGLVNDRSLVIYVREA